MRRRSFLASLVATGPSLALQRAAEAEQRTQQATRGMRAPLIRDVQVIGVQPGNVRLVVVKVITDQDGLYGYGCATFTQRADLVVPAVEKYLRPFLMGRPADRIEDLGWGDVRLADGTVIKQ